MSLAESIGNWAHTNICDDLPFASCNSPLKMLSKTSPLQQRHFYRLRPLASKGLLTILLDFWWINDWDLTKQQMCSQDGCMVPSGIWNKNEDWPLYIAEKEIEDGHKAGVLRTHLFSVASVPSSGLLPLSSKSSLPKCCSHQFAVQRFFCSCLVAGISYKRHKALLWKVTCERWPRGFVFIWYLFHVV